MGLWALPVPPFYRALGTAGPVWIRVIRLAPIPFAAGGGVTISVPVEVAAVTATAVVAGAGKVAEIVVAVADTVAVEGGLARPAAILSRFAFSAMRSCRLLNLTANTSLGIKAMVCASAISRVVFFPHGPPTLGVHATGL